MGLLSELGAVDSGCFSHEAPHCWTQFSVATGSLSSFSAPGETFFQDGEHCT